MKGPGSILDQGTWIPHATSKTGTAKQNNFWKNDNPPPQLLLVLAHTILKGCGVLDFIPLSKVSSGQIRCIIYTYVAPVKEG